uniref:RNA polymerase II-associated factor 1 homolog n=1 Tax=Meloidogyne javanica TaxID=6303 RepID=A0A915N128_MELJA
MDRPTTASNSLHLDSNVQSHRSHSHSHSRSATRGNRQEPGVDLICKVKYTNKLPDLPFEPKFLQSPFPSTLEKNFKYELLTEPDLNVKIDLISTTYQLDGIDKPHLHPIDEQLLEDESIQQLNTKRLVYLLEIK